MWAEPRALRRTNRRRRAGFTVVEVIIVAVIIATVSVWAVPAYVQRLHQIKIDKAILDIALIEAQVNRYFDLNDGYPDSLGRLEPPVPPDPWGRSYQYLTPSDPGWTGKFRKDRFLVPLNSDFDLYSVGPDGESRPPLPPKVSWDDIIRANNGGYIGIAAEF
jgi:general secretion pathway protein G